MKEKITIDDIKLAYKIGEYDTKLKHPGYGSFKADHVFDENLSVKRNREMVVEKNEERKRLTKEYGADVSRLSQKLNDDIVQALMNQNGFNKEQATILRDFVCNKEHSSTNDYLESFDEYVELVTDMINAGNK